jgi:hypothetical protein
MGNTATGIVMLSRSHKISAILNQASSSISPMPLTSTSSSWLCHTGSFLSHLGKKDEDLHVQYDS